MVKIGIVGLPNAGKSTLFNALVSKYKAAVASHPFTTIDKNVGVVEVPDETLFKLAKIENIAKVTPATITFIDIAGLIKGAHQGEGLGNQFLHHIREVDLILHVVRFFKSEDVPHIHPKIDPKEDVEIVNEELLLADLQTLEKKLTKEKTTTEERSFIQKFIRQLNRGKFAAEVEVDDKEKELVKSLNLLTSKRQLLVANIGEEEIKNPPKTLDGKPLLTICAKLEADLEELPWVEAQQFLKAYGLEKSAKERIILEAYKSLDLVTFYTIAKRRQARAWSLKKNSTALEAAGKIHTDFSKYFVKVEAIAAEQLIKIGSWSKAKELGKIGLHGRDYIVEDGDVLEFKIAMK
ncbi:MAG: redox-regulated ATPase YchF [Microgenomates group bacterium]